MVSMQNQLRCPHCFCKLEVSAVISQLSLQYKKESNKEQLEHQRDLQDETTQDEVIALPAPTLRVTKEK